LIRFLNAHFPARIVLLGISEALLVTVVFVGAAVAIVGGSNAVVSLGYERGLLKILVVSATFLLCMYYFDFYDSRIVSGQRGIPLRLIQMMGAVCVILAILYHLYPSLELGRGIVVTGVLLVGVAILLWRKLFVAINSRTEFADRALLLGNGPLSIPLMQEVDARPELGLRVVSQLVLPGNESEPESEPVSSSLERLSRAVEMLHVNRILVSLGDRRGNLPVEALLELKSRGVKIEDGADLYEAITGKVPFESVRLGWLLYSPSFCASRFLRVYKRLASIVVSIFGLAVTLPVVPLILAAIKLTSQGDALYKQKRVGLNGKVFDCYKFRTMRADAEADSGPTWAGDDDPRITAVGRFLRMTRLDEIPQLWNVLQGDMCLVGPRPERPEFVEWLSNEIPHYQLRNTVRPGISGWAQIRFKYSRSLEDSREKLRYDLFYLKNMSPGLDFLVFLETIKVILFGRGAQ
jgi:sugar transferase (PEP-CTERM system associated)